MTSFAGSRSSVIPITRTVTPDADTAAAANSPALQRFVVDGLNATLDAYLAGGLSPRRFCWELAARIEQLAELDAPTRPVTRLRWLQRTVELLHTGPAGSAASTGEVSTGDEENSLTVTLVDLRTVLATLGPDSPPDPTGAARPTQPALLRLVA